MQQVMDIQPCPYLLENYQHKQEYYPKLLDEAFFHFHRKETKYLQLQFIFVGYIFPLHSCSIKVKAIAAGAFQLF